MYRLSQNMKVAGAAVAVLAGMHLAGAQMAAPLPNPSPEAGVIGGACGTAQAVARFTTLKTSGQLTLDEQGDAQFHLRLKFQTEAAYTEQKKLYPNPYVMVRELLGANSSAETRDAKVDYEDQSRTIVFSGRLLGAAVCKSGRWQRQVAKGVQEISNETGHLFYSERKLAAQGFDNDVVWSVQLPKAACDSRLDSERGLLSYRLTRKACEGSAELEVTVKAKERVMSSLYKVYGNPQICDGALWVAKTVFHNPGTGDITDLQVRYRMGDYADWSAPVSYDLVAPGATVVDLYYPIIKRAVSELRSATPAQLEVQYSYTEAGGKHREATTSSLVQLLGINQFEFANLPEVDRTGHWYDNFANSRLLAAYVTHLDEPVRALGGMVAQCSGGADASASDQSAYIYCRSLYQLLCYNGVSYSTASGFTVENDATGQGQNVKFPREVLRDKTGTCIDLAILFAAVCENTGLKTYLAVCPHHCFPVIELPQTHNLLPVEITTVDGSAVGKCGTFSNALYFGAKSLKNFREQPHFLINVDDLQSSGVAAPELPACGETPLKAWGWRNPVEPETPSSVTIEVKPQAPAAQAVQPSPVPQPAQPAPEQPSVVVSPLPPFVLAGKLGPAHQRALPMTLRLSQVNSAIEGSTDIPGLGQGPVTGLITGNTVTFAAKLQGPNGEVTVNFIGRLRSPGLEHKNEIKGTFTCTTGNYGNFQVAKR